MKPILILLTLSQLFPLSSLQARDQTSQRLPSVTLTRYLFPAGKFEWKLICRRSQDHCEIEKHERGGVWTVSFNRQKASDMVDAALKQLSQKEKTPRKNVHKEQGPVLRFALSHDDRDHQGEVFLYEETPYEKVATNVVLNLESQFADSFAQGNPQAKLPF